MVEVPGLTALTEGMRQSVRIGAVHPSEPDRPHRELVAFLGLAALAIFALDVLLPLGVAVGVLYAALVLLSLWYPQRHLTVLLTGASVVLIVLGYFWSPDDVRLLPWVSLVNRAIAVVLLLTAGALVQARKRYDAERLKLVGRMEAMLSEIKTLSGLVPICAACKKIRDNNGIWDDLEVYIQAHSDAQFTHGLCPECVANLYGNLTTKESA